MGMFKKALPILFAVLWTGGALVLTPSSAWAVSDIDTLQRVVSANRRAIEKTRKEMSLAPDAEQRSKLKNKLVVLENDLQRQSDRLQLYSMRAGDWANLSDPEKQKHVRDAQLPVEYADRLTIYILNNPTEINVPLGALLLDQARRYARTQGN